MTKLEKIERDIAALSTGELDQLAGWFADHHAALWDRQITDDAASGRLDALIANAKQEIAAGKTRPL